jgi:thioredoxin 1
MKLLISQVEFEELIGLQTPAPGTVLPNFTVIYFTASWCGACRSIKPDVIEQALPGVNWLKCDVDANNYTPGYCNVNSIPTFLIVADKKVVDKKSSNRMETILAWVTEHYVAAGGVAPSAEEAGHAGKGLPFDRP